MAESNSSLRKESAWAERSDAAIISFPETAHSRAAMTAATVVLGGRAVAIGGGGALMCLMLVGSSRFYLFPTGQVQERRARMREQATASTCILNLQARLQTLRPLPTVWRSHLCASLPQDALRRHPRCVRPGRTTWACGCAAVQGSRL